MVVFFRVSGSNTTSASLYSLSIALRLFLGANSSRRHM